MKKTSMTGSFGVDYSLFVIEESLWWALSLGLFSSKNTFKVFTDFSVFIQLFIIICFFDDQNSPSHNFIQSMD